jgi:hypothetical protein
MMKYREWVDAENLRSAVCWNPIQSYPLGLRVGVGHVTKTLGAALPPAPLYHLYRIYTLLRYVTAAIGIHFNTVYLSWHYAGCEEGHRDTPFQRQMACSY